MSKKKKKTILTVGSIIILFLVIGGIFFWISEKNNRSPSNAPPSVPNNNQNPNQAPTPTNDNPTTEDLVKEAKAEIKEALKKEDWRDLPFFAFTDQEITIFYSPKQCLDEKKRNEGRKGRKISLPTPLTEKDREELWELFRQISSLEQEKFRQWGEECMKKVSQNPQLFYDPLEVKKEQQNYYEFNGQENGKDYRICIPTNHSAFTNLFLEKRRLYLITGMEKIKMEKITKDNVNYFDYKFAKLSDKIMVVSYSD